MNLFFLIHSVSLSTPALGNEIEEWNHGLPFRRPAFVYNNKRPVIPPFLSFWYSWAALSRERSQASGKNICLSKARPVSINTLLLLFVLTPTRFYQDSFILKSVNAAENVSVQLVF